MICLGTCSSPLAIPFLVRVRPSPLHYLFVSYRCSDSCHCCSLLGDRTQTHPRPNLDKVSELGAEAAGHDAAIKSREQTNKKLQSEVAHENKSKWKNALSKMLQIFTPRYALQKQA